MAGSNKFELNIMQNLDAIEQMLRDGVDDKVIAKQVGVGQKTFERYKKQGKEAYEREQSGEKLDKKAQMFCDFWTSYRHARKTPIEVVEASLFLSCQDRTIDKTITIRRYDPEGKLMWIEEKTEKVPVAASVPAQQFYLANKKRKDWEYKPETKTEATDEEQKAVVIVEKDKRDTK